jgi:flagellar biosynthesis/type III secretory pathway M-ring protein FliF/YscJ
MAMGIGIRAGVVAAALAGAAGSAWAAESGEKAWAGQLDPAAVGALALLVVAVVLSSVERRRRQRRQRELTRPAPSGASVTPHSVDREPRRPASGPAPELRAAGRQR